MKNTQLKQRIFEISYKHGLSHIGSCLTAVDIIADIFREKKPDEKFILSSGHAGLALYVILEANGGKNAEEIFAHHGVHPDRCVDCGIDCSAGSLGNGLPIAAGMAMAQRNRNVYCLISDGEIAEGSIWEALRISKENHLENLKIHINFNGYGAYKEVGIEDFIRKSIGFAPNRQAKIHRTSVDEFPFLRGLEGHYHVMNETEYKEALQICEGTSLNTYTI